MMGGYFLSCMFLDNDVWWTPAPDGMLMLHDDESLIDLAWSLPRQMNWT